MDMGGMDMGMGSFVDVNGNSFEQFAQMLEGKGTGAATGNEDADEDVVDAEGNAKAEAEAEA